MSRPIAWAMSISLGSCSASARKCRIELVVVGEALKLLGEARIEFRRVSRAGAPRCARSSIDERDLLRRLPAVERIGIVADQEQAVLRRQIGLHVHRRRELAEERRDRARPHAVEDDLLTALW